MNGPNDSPTSWGEVSLTRYQRLLAVPADLPPAKRELACVAVMLGKSEGDVRKMDQAEYNRVCRSLAFSAEPPDRASWRPRVVLDGKEYGFVPNLSDLSLGEVIDLEEAVADWNNSLHKLASILYRPVVSSDGDGYRVEPFDPEACANRARRMADRLSAQDMYGASLFFCLVGTGCLASTPVSSGSPTQTTTRSPTT